MQFRSHLMAGINVAVYQDPLRIQKNSLCLLSKRQEYCQMNCVACENYSGYFVILTSSSKLKVTWKWIHLHITARRFVCMCARVKVCANRCVSNIVGVWILLKNRHRIDFVARIVAASRRFWLFLEQFFCSIFLYFPLPPYFIPRNFKTDSVYQVAQPIANPKFQ